MSAWSTGVGWLIQTFHSSENSELPNKRYEPKSWIVAKLANHENAVSSLGSWNRNEDACTGVQRFTANRLLANRFLADRISANRFLAISIHPLPVVRVLVGIDVASFVIEVHVAVLLAHVDFELLCGAAAFPTIVVVAQAEVALAAGEGESAAWCEFDVDVSGKRSA